MGGGRGFQGNILGWRRRRKEIIPWIICWTRDWEAKAFIPLGGRSFPSWVAESCAVPLHHQKKKGERGWEAPSKHCPVQSAPRQSPPPEGYNFWMRS